MQPLQCAIYAFATVHRFSEYCYTRLRLAVEPKPIYLPGDSFRFDARELIRLKFDSENLREFTYSVDLVRT